MKTTKKAFVIMANAIVMGVAPDRPTAEKWIKDENQKAVDGWLEYGLLFIKSGTLRIVETEMLGDDEN